jgi:hypothetical protein
MAAVPLLRSSASRDVDRLLNMEQLDATALSNLLSSGLSTRRVGSQMDRSLHVLRQATQRNDLLQQISNSTHSTSTSSTGIAVTAEVRMMTMQQLSCSTSSWSCPNSSRHGARCLLAEPPGRAARRCQHLAFRVRSNPQE